MPMAVTVTTSNDDVSTVPATSRSSAAAVGLAAALVLMTAAMVVPVVAGWNVQIGFAPLSARWAPRVGPGTLVAVPLAAASICYAGRLSLLLTWPRLLLLCWLAGLGWLASLALVDIRPGGPSYSDTNDLLQAARATSDISQTLHAFVSRIPLGPDGWSTHVAGHPAGALLFFVLLVRVGLGGNIAAGIVITLLASTIPLAGMSTLRALGAERAARLAAPFLVFTPAVIWEAVSADAIFACFAAWGLAALAVGATRHSISWSLVAGLLLGACVELSYGLPLLGILAVGVLVAAGTLHPLPWAVVGALLVVGCCWLAGFSLWDAYPAIHQRYYAGIAGARPASYWLWGDLAALCFSAGPILGSSVACWVLTARGGVRGRGERTPDQRVVTILGGAALLSIIAADLSLMSKAEVERIWLPFVPWLLMTCSLLPPRWRRPALAVQVITALLVQHLLITSW